MNAPKPLVIGIAGGIASGKSTVAGLFHRWGARILNADQLARTYLQPNQQSYARLVRTFGQTILKNSGQIDRKKLGDIVFRDPRALKRLNRIIHPSVVRDLRKTIKRLRHSSARFIVVDAPLLLEAGLVADVDVVIIVMASRTNQIHWLRKRGFAGQDAGIRIRSQMAPKKRLRNADFVIHNSSTLGNLRTKALRIWQSLTRARNKKGY